MKPEKSKLQFFIKLARVAAQITRRFDTHSGMFGWSGFQVLYHLNSAPEHRMRRIDLADKLALTASGVTRMLLPMEKLGLVEREACEGDARVSFVKLTPAGRRQLAECTEDVELLAGELLITDKDGRDPMEFFSIFAPEKLTA